MLRQSPKAYIMLGRIASGKSYIAEQYAEKEGCVILSVDEIIWSLFDGCLGDKLQETEQRAAQYLLTLAQRIGKLGGNVIFDCGLFSRESRKAVESKLRLLGFEVCRILVKCDEETRHQRLNRRNLQRAGGKNKAYILPYEKVLKIEENRYQEPTADEYDILIENK